MSGSINNGVTTGTYAPCFLGAINDSATGSKVVTNQQTWTNEYTTPMLEANTVAALPSFGALQTYGGTSFNSIASAALSMDQSHYVMEAGEYQFAHPVPASGQYTITWNETFVPDGGSPVSTPKSYTWNGVIPPGYDPANMSTWPTSPLYSVSAPSSNGQVNVDTIVGSCS